VTLQHRAIVITTINRPTEPMQRFAGLDDWQLFVVADRKTPVPWQVQDAVFLPVDDKRYALATRLPFDHYSRKMLGYLAAVEAGARVIAESDDDNLPYPGWGFPAFDGEFSVSPSDHGFVNVYKTFTDQHIWPRGLPLDVVLDTDAVVDGMNAAIAEVRVGVWQGLADGDPDVDAIYRLTQGGACTFEQRPPIVLGAGTACPFNSQNTAFREELFALLYLPATVSFRFTDILRGLVAQPIMWAAGFRLGFTSATVYQDRNVHDYLRDFESEIGCYLHVRRVSELVQGAVSPKLSVNDNLMAAYDSLAIAGLVEADELKLVSHWLEDLQQART
jgi:hypothetical protein